MTAEINNLVTILVVDDTPGSVEGAKETMKGAACGGVGGDAVKRGDFSTLEKMLAEL